MSAKEPRHLIIFDIDGTLFQTDCVTVPAVQRTFSDFGLAVPSRETITGFFGKSVAAYESWLARQCPAGMAADIVAATNALELKLVGTEGKLYPKVIETLELFKKEGYYLAVCSNGPSSYVNEVVNTHNLRPFFHCVYARDTRYSGEQEMIGLILRELAPHQFVVIGDRHDDIEAAHACGGRGIAVNYGFGAPEEWLRADAIVSAITETPPHVARLVNQPTVKKSREG
ncbi:MAG TPA: HAD family hydrolase [Candidatus Hydrogenedentes bacterium]|nr:HAD family hydrolase [Candidatus Hydrogenedentota bacterium]